MQDVNAPTYVKPVGHPVKWRNTDKYHTPYELELNGRYLIAWGSSTRFVECIFIKPTRRGYNFLRVDLGKCVLKQHVYPSNRPQHFNQNTFYLNSKIRIMKKTQKQT